MLLSGNTLFDAIFYAIGFTLILMVPFAFNARVFWHDMPKAIKEKTEPPDAQEKHWIAVISIFFFGFGLLYPIFSAIAFNNLYAGRPGFWAMFWHVFWMPMAANLVDWLILDWLLFATIRPKFMAIPGTHGDPAYHEYKSHFIGFLIGSSLSIFMGLLFAVIFHFII